MRVTQSQSLLDRPRRPASDASPLLSYKMKPARMCSLQKLFGLSPVAIHDATQQFIVKRDN